MNGETAGRVDDIRRLILNLQLGLTADSRYLCSPVAPLYFVMEKRGYLWYNICGEAGTSTDRERNPRKVWKAWQARTECGHSGGNKY